MTEVLKDNEKNAYEKLRKMAQVGQPIELSTRNFDLKLVRKQWKYDLVEYPGSHTAVRKILRRLEDKGFLTVQSNGRMGTTVVLTDKKYEDGEDRKH